MVDAKEIGVWKRGRLDTLWFDAMDDFFDSVEHHRGTLTYDEIRQALADEYGDAVVEAWDERRDGDEPNDIPTDPEIDREVDEDHKSNPAFCAPTHRRTGLVSNRNPADPYVEGTPEQIVSVCGREACQERMKRRVAAATNQNATYYDDAERRAQKESQ